MNVKKGVFILFVISIFLPTLASAQQSQEKVVKLHTTYGDIRIKLYDDTPGHRDNFVKNVEDGMYDGVTFHRVIRNFMVQTGNPDTRPESTEKVEPEDTTQMGPSIPAEIRFPQHYHKSGVVAAARESDEINPDKRSSQYQFYIVTGRFFNEVDMEKLEQKKQEEKIERLYEAELKNHADEIRRLDQARDRVKVEKMLEGIYDQVKERVAEQGEVFYPNEMRRSYRINGGTPWLDGEYTIFGEVIEGMKIVNKIQKVKTDDKDEPIYPIRIIKATME